MDLIVIEIDNFELSIGNTFMKTVGVGVFLQLGGLMIMNKAGLSFIRGQRGPSRVEDCTIRVRGEQL